MEAKYDTIGVNYSDLRIPDPRIAERIEAALGPALSILNVGAGCGAYEPAGRRVTALDPSREMMRQRRQPAHELVVGVAENLPFADRSFDASMAVLTVHHWQDPSKGLREMRRVTRGPVVILTFDPAHRDIWLLDYLPGLADLDDRQMPPLFCYGDNLGAVEVVRLLIPHDCSDGFLYAYWRRPAAYLDPRLRSGSSSFWALEDVSDGLARLKTDLQSGEWARRYPDLAGLRDYDTGYRLVVSR